VSKIEECIRTGVSLGPAANGRWSICGHGGSSSDQLAGVELVRASDRLITRSRIAAVAGAYIPEGAVLLPPTASALVARVTLPVSSQAACRHD
jgi:hypothetical protein